VLVDLDAVPDWQAPAGDSQAEVAIAGGGLAGLLLATRLANAGRRVIVLEASSAAQAARSQPFYRAAQIGQPTLAADATRLRFLGGSTNHWGGWCRPLEAEDLSSRPGADFPGWPFGPETLAPYLADAAAALGIAAPPPPGPPIDGSEGLLQPIAFGFSTPPLAAGLAFGPALAGHEAVTLVLNANVVGAEAGADGRLSQLLVRGYAPGPVRRVPARLFVLALGAMESVRLLLILNRQFGNRLGNAGGLVGLGYMQHLHGRLGRLVRLFPGPDPALLQAGADGRPPFLATTGAFLAAVGGRARLYAEPAGCEDADDWLARLACATGGLRYLRGTAEQWPSRQSRLLLGEGADPLGLPPLVIDWRPSAGDKERLRRAAVAYGAWLARSSGWRLQLADWLLAADAALPVPSPSDAGDQGASGHQMGGARMASTPDQGVTDIDSLVYGSGNLYLASSAVFAGGGHAPPTLTLAQLTLRLADRLERRLAAP